MIITRGYGKPPQEATIITRGYGYALGIIATIVREVWRGLSYVARMIELKSRV